MFSYDTKHGWIGLKLHLWKQMTSFYLSGYSAGRVPVNTSFILSDTMWEHGACNVQKVSSPTRREWCHRPWGPVNAAVPRAWRRGRGKLHTVFTRIPAGRACSTATRSTPWETRRTATGGLQADVWRVSSKRCTTIIINIYLCIYLYKEPQGAQSARRTRQTYKETSVQSLPE